jgi:2-methylisocitrate lyase-like PEP mutase family enzyme
MFCEVIHPVPSLGRLYGNLLYPLHVRVLRIEDTPLLHIEEHSFLGVNRTLQELHIVRSELQEFPTLAFQVRSEQLQKRHIQNMGTD